MKDVILTVCIPVGIVSKLKKWEGLNHKKSFYVQIVNANIVSIFSKKPNGTPPPPPFGPRVSLPMVFMYLYSF